MRAALLQFAVLPKKFGIPRLAARRCSIGRLIECFLVVVLAVMFVHPAATAQNQSGDVGSRESGGNNRLQNPVRDTFAIPPGALDGGSEWLNTAQPISLRDLRGKVVLLDFWTYCCINCIHILPDLKYLEEKYDRQLIVIGVHSAKFANEKLSQNIRDAILRYEIRHPVVNDSDLMLWGRFGVNSWPTVVLIDPEGNFAGTLSGEGHRDKLDDAIGKLVQYHRANGTLDETPTIFALESDRTEPTPLRYPGKVLADPSTERLFISDSNHNRIVIVGFDGRLIDTIGSGRIGLKDGTFEDAEFDHPQGCALVGEKLYVADTENHAIRTVDLKLRTVTTLAGTGRQAPFSRTSGGKLQTTALNSPWSLAHVNGTLYIAMAGPHQIWSHTLGSDRITRFAGSGTEDVIDGIKTKAAFAQPSELVGDASGQFLFVVDSEGSSVRSVPIAARGVVTTIAGTSNLPQGRSLFAFGDQDGIGAQARFQHPLGIASHNNRLYIADSYNHKIRIIDLTNSAVTTWLGNGQAGDSLEPPQLSEPGGLSYASGKLYIADTNNHRICVADVSTGAMEVLSIPDLRPPVPIRAKSIPSTPVPQNLLMQAVRAEDQLSFVVDLSVPAGYKLNELNPVTWEVYAEGSQSIIPPEALGARDEATIDGTTAAFSVPLTADSGDAALVIFVNYGYCTENSTLCRLASAAWRVPVSLGAQNKAERIMLKFPDTVAAGAGAGVASGPGLEPLRKP